MQDLVQELKVVYRDVAVFSQTVGGVRLRPYQAEVARCIADSVLGNLGLTFVVILPRQSGKNEVQAQIEAYLLALLNNHQAEIVKISPTWRPQSQNAMRRLERALARNPLIRHEWVREQGYIYRLNTARVFFFSGEPQAHIVGATASTLLECDEAQDVLPSKWDKEVSPMAASTNATRVFWGTAWTSQTLLARELRQAEAAQREDGRRRVFRLTADEVAQVVPAYGRFVEGEIRKHGREHPFIRTQYFSEEIDGEGGMFPAARRDRMQGCHSRQVAPAEGSIYAFLLDVAGEDEGAMGGEALANRGRDATALTIVEVCPNSQAAGGSSPPVYRVVNRRLWTGIRHSSLFGELSTLIEIWQPHRVVVDATGVGAGLASFLNTACPGRLLPFSFNTATKSRLGWDFLSVIETGRFQDWAPVAGVPAGEQAIFWRQATFCQMRTDPGPERRVHWGVPDSCRDPLTGELVHDDLLVSAALCAALDTEGWGAARSAVIAPVDPLEGMEIEDY